MLGIVDMAAKKTPFSDVVHYPVGAARKQTHYSSMMSFRMGIQRGLMRMQKRHLMDNSYGSGW